MMDSHSEQAENGLKETEQQGQTKGQQSQHVTCSVCDFSLLQTSVGRHMKLKHGINQQQQRYACCLCPVRVPTRGELNEHISSEHGVPMSIEHRVFHDVDEFKNWKAAEEKTTVASFVRRTETRLKNGTKVDIYWCNRRGKRFEIQTPRQRLMKLGGSIKCGVECPARMKVDTVEHYGGIEMTVEYCSTHIGHDMDPDKLRIPKDDRGPTWRRRRRSRRRRKTELVVSNDQLSGPETTLISAAALTDDFTNGCQAFSIGETDDYHIKTDVVSVELCKDQISADTLNTSLLIYTDSPSEKGVETVEVSLGTSELATEQKEPIEQHREVVLTELRNMMMFAQSCSTLEELNVIFECVNAARLQLDAVRLCATEQFSPSSDGQQTVISFKTEDQISLCELSKSSQILSKYHSQMDDETSAAVSLLIFSN